MAGDPLPPPVAAPRAGWRFDALWLLALAAWSAGWCLSAAPRLGATFDEPFYLDAGLEAWRGWTRTDGRPRGFDHHALTTNGVMPLPIDAVTLPLYLIERHTGERFEDRPAQLDRLQWCRAMTLGWLWLLILSAWRLGRAAGGPWAGRLAAGLIAADPNFLAHASLATTDIAVSATLLAFTRAVYAGRGGGWWKRLLHPGLWYGAAVTCKLSALLYGGLILVALEVCHRFATGALARPDGPTTAAGLWWAVRTAVRHLWTDANDREVAAWAWKFGGAVFRSVANAVGVLTIGIAVATAYCGFSDEDPRALDVVATGTTGDEAQKPRSAAWAVRVDRFPHAADALGFQSVYNSRGQPSFLNGTYYPEGYRYYFPLLLLMKVPLPVFALALVALARGRAAANPLALTAVLVLAPLLTANVQLGVRLAFPAVAVGYVALAVALGRGYPRCAPWIGLPAVLAIGTTALWVWPHGLGYLNQAHGGPDAAPRRVSDSNVDWGHGLPDLKRWHGANGEPPLCVWYFGTDPAVNRPPFQPFVPEHASDPDGRPIEITDAAALRRAVGPRVLAVGHSVVALHPRFSPEKAVALEYLNTRRPLAHTATFTLYDFRDPAGPPPRE